MTTDLTGILVAMPTHFTADGGEIDVAALHDHVNWLIEAGIHGLVPGGSTGEFTTLTTDERKRLIEEMVKAADGRVPVVAALGALSTREGEELARHAADVGAAALMVVAPFYDTPDLEEIRAHYQAIHQASGLDIMFYNLPTHTGLELTPAEIAGLSEVGVRWLKDTSGNAPAFNELLLQHADEVTAFNGYDTLTFLGLALGAKGSVWGASNIIPELSVQLWNALAVEGDLARGRELWTKIYPVCEFLERGNYAASIKAGMDLIGHGAGPVRAPFKALDESARAEFTEVLTGSGVL